MKNSHRDRSVETRDKRLSGWLWHSRRRFIHDFDVRHNVYIGRHSIYFVPRMWDHHSYLSASLFARGICACIPSLRRQLSRRQGSPVAARFVPRSLAFLKSSKPFCRDPLLAYGTYRPHVRYAESNPNSCIEQSFAWEIVCRMSRERFLSKLILFFIFILWFQSMEFFEWKCQITKHLITFTNNFLV